MNVPVTVQLIKKVSILRKNTKAAKSTKSILSGRFCDQNRRVGETVPYPGEPRIIPRFSTYAIGDLQLAETDWM